MSKIIHYVTFVMLSCVACYTTAYSENIKPNEAKQSSAEQNIQNKVGENLPPELLEMLKQQNIDLGSVAANQAQTEIHQTQADLKKAEQIAKEKAKQAEEQHLNDERKKQSEFMPEFFIRTPYDHKGEYNPAIHKSSYGSQNSHLPPIIDKTKHYNKYIFQAASKGDVGAIKTLVDNGADVNARSSKSGSTPLMYAAKDDRSAAIRYLIQVGANCELKNNRGNNALQIAKVSGAEKAYKTLIELGCDKISKATNYYTNNEDFVAANSNHSLQSDYNAKSISKLDELEELGNIDQNTIKNVDDSHMHMITKEEKIAIANSELEENYHEDNIDVDGMDSYDKIDQYGSLEFMVDKITKNN